MRCDAARSGPLPPAVNRHSLHPCPIAAPRPWSPAWPSASSRSSTPPAAIAGESGMSAVQIATVAKRAGIAAGTVYRYFPSKTELDRRRWWPARPVTEIEAMTAAGDAAPGPLSALAAAIACFAARVLLRAQARLGAIAEPVEAEIEAVRLNLRRALDRRIRSPYQDGRSRAAICPIRMCDARLPRSRDAAGRAGRAGDAGAGRGRRRPRAAVQE